MPRYPSRLLAPALIAALCLAPTFASARPAYKDAVPSAAKRPAASSSVLSKIRDLFSAQRAEKRSRILDRTLELAAKRPAASSSVLSKIRDLFSALWAENGSGLDPNGSDTGNSSGAGTPPPSDNGSGLDPDG